MDHSFPPLTSNHEAKLSSPLPGQIYVIDDFLSPSLCAEVLEWAKGLELEGPKKAGRGEAERTGNRISFPSLHIASSLLPLLLPFLPHLTPAYPSSNRKEAIPALAENIRVYHYPPGAYFGNHYDSPQLDRASRRLSCWTLLVYLSDVEGGGTAFHPHPHPREGGGGGGGGRGERTAKGRGAEKGTSKPKAKAKTKAKTETNQLREQGEGETEEKDKIVVQAKAGRALLHWHGVAGGGCMLHQGESVRKGDKWVLRTDLLA